jgi:uncharacterized paraquat-inducible protein A
LNQLSAYLPLLRQLWLRGATLRELSELTGIPSSTISSHIDVRRTRSPYNKGWLYCRTCERYVHKSVAVKAKRGYICPKCRRKLRTRPFDPSRRLQKSTWGEGVEAE